MNSEEHNAGLGTSPGTAGSTAGDTVGAAHFSPPDPDSHLEDWEKAIVADLNNPPERSLPSVVLPEPPYFDRTIVDRERFMARARPKITKNVLKSIIRGGGDLMRGILVSADGETYYVPTNLMNGFTAGEIDVPITIDEPSWSPGRDRPGGGAGGPQASEDDSDVVYMPISYEEFVELIGLLFDLPFLKPTDADKILSLSLKTRGAKRTGPMARLLKIETAKARIERFNASRNSRPEEFLQFADKEPGFVPTVEEFPFHKVDLRYRRIEEVWDPDSKAVVFYELDTSGSMGGEPLNMAKFFFLLMLLWLRTKYKEVVVVYIAHSGKATRIRDEKDFFRVDANGGTSFTDAHDMVVAIANAEFAGEGWNKYCFHATDGFEQSPQRIAQSIDKIIRAGFNLFGYCEVDLGWGFMGSSQGWGSFDYLSADTKPHCGRGRVKSMDEVPAAMKQIIDIENKS